VTGAKASSLKPLRLIGLDVLGQNLSWDFGGGWLVLLLLLLLLLPL
jgi:hypothetical protein